MLLKNDVGVHEQKRTCNKLRKERSGLDRKISMCPSVSVLSSAVYFSRVQTYYLFVHAARLTADDTKDARRRRRLPKHVW